MVAISIGSLALLRPTLRSKTPNVLRQLIPSSFANKQAKTAAISIFVKTTNTDTQTQTPAMAEINAEMKPMPVLAKADPTGETQENLPKLSAADFQSYNKLAVMMDYYHNHFRRTWTMLYKTASSGQRPSGMSMRSFIHTGLQFCSHINTHHGIEEYHIFPELAKRMPQFQDGDFLKKQHEEIHAGLERIQTYLEACQSGERELRMSELKDIMDSFGEVLWTHLDEEVKTLGAESMRKYWTKAEIARMNW